MLSEEAIRAALHANRVVPLSVANPHGPLGLEQLAATVAAQRDATRNQPSSNRVRRPIELSVQTWEKLHALAAVTSKAGSHPLSAGELAGAILEQYVAESPRSN